MIFGVDKVLLFLLGLGAALIIILAFVVTLKDEKIKKLNISVNQLKNSLDQMDEQAKLIVRTDLELNKIQEELDKKISELYTLQNLSRALSTTLDEKAIFNQIKLKDIEELEMQKALACIWQEQERIFSLELALGYSQEEVENIIDTINTNKKMYLGLIEQERTISSRRVDTKLISIPEIKRIFLVKSFCIAPILPKEGSFGFIILGTNSEDVTMTEGDEELITILANNIGQALENARLFETTFHSQQELEKRVEQRTQELTEVVKQLETVGKRKSDFVSAVSHELRTPLTSIKGYAAILLSKSLGEIPDAVKQRLEKINRHSDELVHMINDLLDITRLESGRIVMKKQPYILKNIIDSVMELLSVQMKEKDISFSVKAPADLEVIVDKSQVERVFMNLIGNATKFTPKKGKITITTEPADDFIQVNISDTGIGIPKEAQDSIFQEFYRVDNPINEKVKGTGLGLSLVRTIIEAHQGKIWVNSTPGKGTTFSFLLPIKGEIKPMSA